MIRHMKVVLLSAGRSFRMAPIADKNFLKFHGKPLIVHQLESLIAAGLKHILIVGGNHNLDPLKELAKKYHSAKIEVVEQKNLDEGMAGAVMTVKHALKKDEMNSPLLFVSANDVVDKEIFKEIHNRLSGNLAGLEGMIVAQKVKSYFPGGYIVTDRRGLVKKIVEKPKEGSEPSDFVNIVIHLHLQPETLFSYIENQKTKPDGHYEKALQQWIAHGARFKVIPYKGYWQAVKYPWHVLELMKHFFPEKPVRGKHVKIAKNAVLHGPVFLDDGVKVMDFAVLQGPCYIGKNTVIGTGSLVRESHIGANSVIGYHSEIARSFLGENVWCHTNYIGDSVIGDNNLFGSGAVTGNLRLDKKNVKVNVNGDRMDSGCEKLGLITGNNVKVGINTSFMPGVKVGANSMIGGGIAIGEDITGESFVTGKSSLSIRRNKRAA